MSRAARPQLRQYVPRTARARLHASVYGPTIHPRLDIGRLVKALRTLVDDVCQTDLEENGPNCRLDPFQISARRASNLFIERYSRGLLFTGKLAFDKIRISFGS